ncbi:MAG: chemotaxis protein CheW, partial [Cyanobacteria bacterium J083]
ALLEAEIVTEVITVNRTEILSVPQMEYCVLGVYSWRSEMLWIVDLENLLGYPPNIEKEQASILHATSYTVLVLQLNGQSLGLVVPSVKDIVEQDWDTLQPPSLELFAKDIQPFLQGYFTENNQHILMLLKATEIIKNF